MNFDGLLNIKEIAWNLTGYQSTGNIYIYIFIIFSIFNFFKYFLDLKVGSLK
jgi:hypothetical protein